MSLSAYTRSSSKVRREGKMPYFSPQQGRAVRSRASLAAQHSACFLVFIYFLCLKTPLQHVHRQGYVQGSNDSSSNFNNLIIKKFLTQILCFAASFNTRLHTAPELEMRSTLATKNRLQQKRIQEQRMSKTFDNIKLTDTDNPTAGDMMTVPQFNMESESVYTP